MNKGMKTKEKDANLVSDFYDVYNLGKHNLSDSLAMLAQKYGMEENYIYRRIFEIKENENLYNSLLQSRTIPQNKYSHNKQQKTFEQLQDECPEELARLLEQDPAKLESMFNTYMSEIQPH